MVSIFTLWLPIVLSAAAVFIISTIIHTVLNYHNRDFGKIESEAELMNDLRKLNIPPGDYMVPCPSSNKERNSQEFKDKVKKGPVASITIYSLPINMGPSLVSWFFYCIVVGIFAAYIAGRALGPGAEYLSAFRFAGCTAFIGYGLALLQNSIWFNRKWSATFKSMFDGLIYGLVTGGIFGWLWP
jgi:hypothetical protein